MFGNVHGQRGLAHAGARCDHDHLSGVQSAGHAVELNEAGGNSGDPAFALVKFLDRLDRFHHLVLHREHLPFEAVFTDRKDSLLYFIEKVAHFVLFLVGAAHALGGSGNDLAQNVFVADDLEVVADVRGSRHKGKQASDKRGAADTLEQISIAQHLRERD